MVAESKMNFNHSDFSETKVFSDKSFTGNSAVWWDFEGKGDYHTRFATN